MARGEYFSFKNLADVRERVARLGLEDRLGFAEPDEAAGVLRSPVRFGPFSLGNRFATHPMEGWDGDPATGAPTPDVIRRWERMGASGAALVWGVEAFAVAPAYRANARQLVLTRENLGGIAAGLKALRAGAGADRPVVGAQLTCSGRYSFGRPAGAPLLLAYHHPELDRRLDADDSTPLMSDGHIEGIVGEYAAAAGVAVEAGFDFLDLKACHRYWVNETLAAKTRPGPYGGEFANRVKPLLMIVDAVQREVGSEVPLGCRLNACDGVPFEEDPATRRPGLKGYGRPEPFTVPYRWGWGVREDDPLQADLAEPLALVGLLKARGVTMFNVTAGSPYSNPHLSRPTESPPVDGYQPAGDPLVEVAAHALFARAVKEAHPDVGVVGTGYSYLRNFKASAAAHAVSRGWTDAAGLGRAILAYPDEAKRLLAGEEARPERGRVVCTGDSACTTGPRFGLKSGCIYDPYYAEVNREINRKLAAAGLNRK